VGTLEKRKKEKEKKGFEEKGLTSYYDGR